jgi:hypothetical protein
VAEGQFQEIQIVRSGGFAGMTRTTHVARTDLPAEDAAALDRLVQSIQFSEVPEPSEGQPQETDRFQYEVTVRTDATHTVRASESSLSEPLRQLIDRVAAVAQRSAPQVELAQD